MKEIVILIPLDCMESSDYFLLVHTPLCPDYVSSHTSVLILLVHTPHCPNSFGVIMVYCYTTILYLIMFYIFDL